MISSKETMKNKALIPLHNVSKWYIIRAEAKNHRRRCFFNMGIYLNNTSAYSLYREDYLLTYFVDKTDILNELILLLESKSKSSKTSGKIPKYICITRPRRFGKSVMANMIAAYFGKGTDSSEVFDQLNVSDFPWYREHLNKHGEHGTVQ